MSLLDELADEDDARRLDAIERAGAEGDASLAPKLLELALTDPADVRVVGGIAEMYREVRSAAAGALGQLFSRHGYDEALVRAAAWDLRYDDAAVGNLLYYLGRQVEPLREALEREAEPRLRLRALRAVLSTQRTPEQTRHALEDPSPLVRVEALTATTAWSEYPRALLDPSREVRLEAARELRAGTRHTDAILAALEQEKDPAVRTALVQCLPMRWRDGEKVTEALTRALDEPAVESRRVAAAALRKVNRPAVGRAIAAHCTTETDHLALYDLLRYAHLPRYGRDLVPFLADVLEKTGNPLLRSAALHALAEYGVPAVEPLLPLSTHSDADVRKAALFALGAIGGDWTLARVKAVRAKAAGAHTRELDGLIEKIEAALARKGALLAAPELAPGGDSTPPQLTVGSTSVPLRPKETVPLATDVVPTAITLEVVCEACGARARLSAAIEFAYLDDDHFGYQELGYVATRWTNCPRCSAVWLFDARFTRTNVRGTAEWTFAWDAGLRMKGATLA